MMIDCQVLTQCEGRVASPVLNSNKGGFSSPSGFPPARISRIKPDKSTFLNSNLLLSNILNHLSPTRSPPPPQPLDAYVTPPPLRTTATSNCAGTNRRRPSRSRSCSGCAGRQGGSWRRARSSSCVRSGSWCSR